MVKIALQKSQIYPLDYISCLNEVPYYYKIGFFGFHYNECILCETKAIFPNINGIYYFAAAKYIFASYKRYIKGLFTCSNVVFQGFILYYFTTIIVQYFS